ncbi:hypothetical protein LTR54_011203 [Friedmanniomyces endolithicus]|uniref:Uncharacterized protein n=1 Tax=Friedmanniomyces endolithicus TaxID=329885 RepID=A0AAN6FLD4_9PEZI|nr:hypothetical protein LTR82_009452 [Friedmanniomyces endolithicus]KAK0993431.1 hypothetical protein LTR54_011203 [Friedmanniomyces endolithicus]
MGQRKKVGRNATEHTLGGAAEDQSKEIEEKTDELCGEFQAAKISKKQREID